MELYRSPEQGRPMFQVLCRWSHRFLRYDFHPTRTGLPILQHTHTLARARSIVMSLPKTHSNQCNTLTTQQRKTRGGGEEGEALTTGNSRHLGLLPLQTNSSSKRRANLGPTTWQIHPVCRSPPTHAPRSLPSTPLHVLQKVPEAGYLHLERNSTPHSKILPHDFQKKTDRCHCRPWLSEQACVPFFSRCSQWIWMGCMVLIPLRSQKVV